MTENDNQYDFILAGGGMAGLSLAYYLNQSETLHNKKILILDKEPKTLNDRTWCFWERGETHAFEEILFRKWQKIDFFSNDFSKRFLLKEYYYKMLRGIDFYRFVNEKLRQNPNIDFVFQEIKSIENTETGAKVISSESEFTADFVFDSVFKPDFQTPKAYFLLQHFKGWVISVEKPFFEPDYITLHDFRIAQNGDEARFFYLLPISSTEALAEYTLFSPQILSQAEYDSELKKYISETLQLSDYQIKETEFGIIPMSDAVVLPKVGNHIYRIGTSGGYVRPATGYTFARTQRFLQKIVQNLESGKSPDLQTTWFDKRFALYDSIMLKVLTEKRYAGAKFFSRLYRKNPIERIFDFLDEQSSFVDELRLMSTAPLKVFAFAALDLIRKRIFR